MLDRLRRLNRFQIAGLVANALLIVLYGLSLVYRVSISQVLLPALEFSVVLYEWFATLPTLRQVFYVSIVLALFAEIYFVGYRLIVREIWRLFFPDLVLRTREHQELHQGRLYWAEALPDTNQYRLHFAPHYGHSLMWIFNQLHTVTIDGTHPRSLSPGRVGIEGQGLRRVDARTWSLTTDALSTQRIEHEAMDEIILERATAARGMVLEAIESNPQLTADRARGDTTSRANIPHWQARQPAGSTVTPPSLNGNGKPKPAGVTRNGVGRP